MLFHCASNLLCNELCGRFAALQLNGSSIRVGARNFSVGKQNEVDLEGHLRDVI